MTATKRRARPPIDFAIITGLSGAGRSEAAKCLEDIGYFVIDNMPAALIDKMAELVMGSGSKVRHIALVLDVRGGEFFGDVEVYLEDLKARGIEYRILFLEADDSALVRRFEEKRRKHPLTTSDRVVEGIALERKLMKALREQADVIVDTSNLNVHELRNKIRSLFAVADPERGIAVNVISFGYKHGMPLDADIVLDVRFLPNPHWVEEFRPLNGTHRKVRGYVLESEAARKFLAQVREMLSLALPGYVKEGRHYLTIAVGCTGGKHRSVVIGDEIARFLQEKGFPSTVVHRDMERE